MRQPRRPGTTRSQASKPRSRATIIPPAPDRTRYQFLGGKGGVGKTTCAAALAIAAAAAGRRTLVMSTDPTPSLGDALGRRLSATPRQVPLGRRGRLHAAVVDASGALDRWLEDRRAALERVALRGTLLDEEDVARLLRLSLPGIDELAALLELLRLGRGGRYDLIVVDTAPTGHTLRMLGMPATLLAVARVFLRMQAKHRVVVEALRGHWQPDSDDLVVSGMAQDASDLSAMLRDRSRVTMSWVTAAEPMAIEETLDAARALAAQDIPLAEVILNRMTPAPRARCHWCAARRDLERRAALKLRRGLGRAGLLPIVRAVRARDTEPIGLRALASVGADLRATTRRKTGTLTIPQEVDSPTASYRPLLAKGECPRSTRMTVTALSDALRGEKVAGSFPGRVPATLIMFGGKGGVGKTTCAAAAGVAAAMAQPDRRVTLVSTDPAHSLADALGAPLDDAPRVLSRGPRNLQARELDAAAAFARVRGRYRGAVGALFDRFGRGTFVAAAEDRRVMEDLIDLAPPGIDELAAIIEVVDTLEAAGAMDLVILDTAPSGHALRLLEMPGLVQEWTRALMSILLKYQPLTGAGEIGSVLLNLSRGLRRLRARLADPARTQFVIVTRAAALPRAESIRLLQELARLHIHSSRVVVNAVGAGDCARCRRQRAQERRELARLERDLASTGLTPEVALTPGRMPPPRGYDALARWHRSWRVTR